MINNYTFITDKIRQIQKEIGLTNFTGFFDMAANGLPKIIEQKKLFIDVYHAALALPVIRNSVKELCNNANYGYKIITNASLVGSDHFPNMQPVVALLLIDDDFIDEGFAGHITRQKKDQYQIIFLVNFSSNTEIEELIRRKFAANCEIIKLPAATESMDLFAQIEANLKEKNIAKLIDIAALQSIKPILDSLKNIIATEAKISLTRKQLISQDNNILRKEEPGSLSSEVITSARSTIQKNILDVEKGFRAKYDDMNKPNIGEFFIQLNTLAGGLAFDDLEQTEVAEKSEKIETKIQEEEVERYKKSIAAKLKTEMKKDISFLEISTAEAVDKVNRTLTDKGLKTINAENFTNPNINIDKIITANNYIQRPYAGELTKKGVMEYFVALRDYTGMIMVVVGLFGPLTMLSSAPTDEKEGFWASLRVISIHLKQFKTIISVFTIVTIFCMIIYGFFDLRKRIPKKRKEEKERELKKAQENLMQEGKRICIDSTRDWTAMISNYIKEFAQNVLNEVDTILRNSILIKQQAMISKRNDLQLNQQSIELKSKNIQAAEREYDMLYKKVTELKEKLNN